MAEDSAPEAAAAWKASRRRKKEGRELSLQIGWDAERLTAGISNPYCSYTTTNAKKTQPV